MKKNIQLRVINNIEIKRQNHRIDISIIVNDYIIIIEDKVNSKAHGNQLSRYFDIAKNELNYPINKIIPIYLTTFYQAHYNNENYELFLLDDLEYVLDFGVQRGVKNAIFIDFAKLIKNRISSILAYKNTEIQYWDIAWVGFFKEIQKSIVTNWLDWGYIQNPLGGFYGMWAHFKEPITKNVKKIHILLKQVKGKNDAEIQFLIEPDEKYNTNIKGQVIFTKNNVFDTEKTLDIIKKCQQITNFVISDEEN
jgi:hypothetical protein